MISDLKKQNTGAKLKTCANNSYATQKPERFKCGFIYETMASKASKRKPKKWKLSVHCTCNVYMVNGPTISI